MSGVDLGLIAEARRLWQTALPNRDYHALVNMTRQLADALAAAQEEIERLRDALDFDCETCDDFPQTTPGTRVGYPDLVNWRTHLCGCETAFDVIVWQSKIMRWCPFHVRYKNHA